MNDGLQRTDQLGPGGLAALGALLAAVLTADHHRGIGADALEVLAAPGRASAFLAWDGDRLDGAAVAKVVDGSAWTIELAVHPARRGRGLGGALLAAALAATPAGTVPAVWAYRPGPAQRRLAERFGLAPALRLEQLRGPTTAAAVPAPSGTRLRPYQAADAAELLRVHNSAFSSELLSPAVLAERLARPFMGPDHVLVAELDGRAGLAGYAWMASPRPDGEGEGHGELVLLAVDPAAAGHGLGLALVSAGLALLAAAGVGRCMLYTDAANTRAVRLYHRAGFRFHHADLLLRPGPGRLSWDSGDSGGQPPA
jgi:mycothiol synthase